MTKLIDAEIKKIRDAPYVPIRYLYDVVLHLPKEDLKVLKIVSLSFIKDYLTTISDQGQIQIVMGLGDYIKVFFNSRHNLELTLIKKPLLFNGTIDKNNISMERYKAIYLTDQNENLKTTEFDQYSRVDLNNFELVNVNLRLDNRCLEPLRIKTFGGVYKNILPEDLIRSVYATECSKILVDGKPILNSINMVPADNKTIIKQQVIKQGTHVIDLPTYMQEKSVGIYNGGIANYFCKYKKQNVWFIFPPYNINTFNDSKYPKIIFYNLPKNKYPTIDKTYRSIGNTIYALCAGNKAFIDTAGETMYEKGSGFKFTDARAILGKPVVMSKDGPIGNRSRLNYEVLSTEREDNLNYARVSSKNISVNAMEQFSNINARNGNIIVVNWEHCDPDLIYPGMPCKYVFSENNLLKSIDGVIISFNVSAYSQTTTIHNKVFFHQATVTIFAGSINDKKITK